MKVNRTLRAVYIPAKNATVSFANTLCEITGSKLVKKNARNRWGGKTSGYDDMKSITVKKGRKIVRIDYEARYCGKEHGVIVFFFSDYDWPIFLKLIGSK